MIATDLAEFLDRYHRSVEAFINGDPEPQKLLWSRADDAVLANPLVPYARGWDAIAQVMDRASALLRDGKAAPVEHISDFATDTVAWTIDIERDTVRIGEAPAPVKSSLRVTTIFRREPDGWKLVHRHADTVTAPRSPESLFTG
jgi:ketosteroid isomerase-like protein